MSVSKTSVKIKQGLLYNGRNLFDILFGKLQKFNCLNNDFSAKELLHLNRGRCHLSSRREKGNIPILKDITAEERQEIILSKINVEYMNQIYGSIFADTL